MQLSETPSLLDALAVAVGCPYVSDLHSGQYAAQLQRAAEGVAEGAFSLEEWNGAISYITKLPADFAAVGEARSYLAAYLRGGR